MGSRRGIGPWVAGVATAGALVGHACTYALVQPGGEARRGLLAATGHAWLHIADEAGAAVAIVAVAAALLGRLTRGRAADVSTATLFGALATFQVVAFAAMELGERASTGTPLGGVVTSGVLPVGVVVQLAVAMVAAATLSRLLRSADRLAPTFPQLLAPPRTTTAIPLLTRRPQPEPVRAAPSIRGPPSAVR
jgi:hypothetical protein